MGFDMIIPCTWRGKLKFQYVYKIDKTQKRDWFRRKLSSENFPVMLLFV